MSHTYDALIVADCRFAGGSTAALVSDVLAMAALGMRLGLIFVRSSYLSDERDKPNPKALALADVDGVTLLKPATPARAELAFIHHPMVIFRGIEERLNLSADRAVIVTHHPPFRADGSLEWDPVATYWSAKRQTGLSAWFAPISGVVRAQLASFAPFVRQTSNDWPNTFDPADWPNVRPVLAGPMITIGRHSRPDPLKFPATGAEIDASLPAGERFQVRVLGCPAEALAERGAHPACWEVLTFGAEPVADFLNTLDVFTYHYHHNWQEAFGRTVVEAILCGRPCLLDPRLEPTFGGKASYCLPADTADALVRMAESPEITRSFAATARQNVIERYAVASVAGRLAALRTDAGIVRRENVAAKPARVLRKMAGLYRRREARASG